MLTVSGRLAGGCGLGGGVRAEMAAGGGVLTAIASATELTEVIDLASFPPALAPEPAAEAASL
jgi:hypothetical protein